MSKPNSTASSPLEGSTPASTPAVKFSSSKNVQLPPPPTFDPNVLGNLGTIRHPGNSKPLEKDKVLESLSSLPTPPPLPIKGTVDISKSKMTVAKGLPVTENPNTSEHSTTEAIPNLDSAPNSTGNPLHQIPSYTQMQTKTINKGIEDEPGQISSPQTPIQKRITSNMTAPPLEMLSPTQSHIPILLLSTSSAKALASKNNLTLPELFTAMGNSLPTHAPSILGRLAPFRSVNNRSIMLNWDLFRLIFYDPENFNVRDKTMKDVTQGEKILGCGCELWPSDLEIGDNKGKGLDLNELEERIENMILHLQEETSENGVESSLENIDAVQAPVINRNGSDLDVDVDMKDVNGNVAEKAAATKAFDLVSSHQMPWLLRFRSGLDQITSHLPHDLFNTPPLCLLVASTSEGNGGLSPIDCLQELKLVHHLPKAYQNGLMNPEELRRQYVILHDEVNGPKHFKEGTLLQEMQKRFGPGCCTVLRINSVSPQLAQKEIIEDAVWDNFTSSMNKPLSKSEFMADSTKARGLCLSSRDKLALRRFIAQMITLSLIPTITTRIGHLNISVTNGKKGVKNAFKSLWRKPKESSGMSSSIHGGKSINDNAQKLKQNPGDVKYHYDSIESQTRLLADTLFLMKDFEESLRMYRLVKDDYKQDGNLFHYASVYEMMALCLFLMDPYGERNTRDVVQNLQTAIYFYTRAAEDENIDSGIRPSVASTAKRCATRLCLILSSTRILCKNRDVEIADLLASASSSETPLGAAVLLEQSSAHYYRGGMYRKFGFHMLMAGHMFRSAGQEGHTIRCFTSAMYIFESGKRRWDTLSNHLISALAGQLYGMDRMGLSLQLYARLVGTQGGGRVSVRSQQKFLDHLKEICRKYKRDAMIGAEQMRLVGSPLCTVKESKGSERFNKLLNCTPLAERVLEIPNMQLPHIFDSSLLVQVESLSPIKPGLDAKGMSTTTIFHNKLKGLESVWNDMICSTEAELQVSTFAKSQLTTEDWIQRVVLKIDEEKANMKFMERSQKSRHESPSVRARMEPLAVTFAIENPLNIRVSISQIQLVAKLKCASTGRIFTNEGAINIPVSEDTKSSKIWPLNSSNNIFHDAEFSRISPQSMQDSNPLQQPWLSAKDESVQPFFVVTKLNMSIEPSKKATVTLGICPLVMGQLDILGVRFKIFDEVWVYHEFKILGPLLHDTAINRTNRVRSVSCALRSKIDCDMPNLFVDIIPSSQGEGIDGSGKGILLQGQISRAILRVSNRGTAPASDLVLKTNVPWISISGFRESSDTSAFNEFSATSCCVGPTGTLMRLPLGTSKHSNALYPGKSVEILIEIRTSGGGNQDFYMLFRYQLFDNVGKSSNVGSQNPKIRWLRKMSSIAVYPSLTVTASLMPSHLKKCDHILSIEMANYRSDSQSKLDIILDRVCIASKHYCIKPMITQIRAKVESSEEVNKQDVLVDGLGIGWQEQVTLHFLISPSDMNESLCTFSECVVKGRKVAQLSLKSKKYSSITDFICLEHAHEHFIGTLEDHQKDLARVEAEKEKEGQHPRSVAQIRRAQQANTMNPDESKNHDAEREDYRMSHPTSIANLCSPQHNSSEINVICSWITTGTEGTIHGQHHLRQLAVRPQHRSKGCPLIISAQHESYLNHDFSGAPLHVDMEITIRNRLVQSNVDFAFSVSQQQDFHFIGAECFRWNLEGGGEISFPMKVAIFSSGIYDLQCVKIIFYQPDGTETPYVFPLQWIVKVDSK